MTSRRDNAGDGKLPRLPTTDESVRTPRGFARSDQIVPDPWRVPLLVEQMPETGLEREIIADAGERAAIAAVGGLRAVISMRATLILQPERDSHVRVTGQLSARIGQVCVVSLDDMETEIDDEIDVTFAPPSKIPTLASTIDDSIDDDSEIPDPPEPIQDGAIDIGRIATDALYLAIDPYPRKAGVIFDPPVEQVDPDDHPFAALKALKEADKND